jgi:hypothetical protein
MESLAIKLFRSQAIGRRESVQGDFQSSSRQASALWNDFDLATSCFSHRLWLSGLGWAATLVYSMAVFGAELPVIYSAVNGN